MKGIHNKPLDSRQLELLIDTLLGWTAIKLVQLRLYY